MPRRWPPPRPSTRRTLARHLLTGSAAAPTLEYVSGRLQAALEGNGYVEYSYYSVPGGFALATRLERIHPDGRSMTVPKRWQVAHEPLTRFDLAEYLRALLREPHYSTRAEEMGRIVRAEDGTEQACQALEAFIHARGRSATLPRPH